METDDSGFSGGGKKFFGGGGSKFSGKPKSVCKFFVQGNCKQGDNCKFLHTFSPVDNIDLIASCKVSENPVGDIAFLKVGDKMNIVTMDSQAQVQVFSPEEKKVVETFAPEGQVTCLRVFQQYPEILFIAYSKQAPNGSTLGCLLALSGAHRIEVEAHEGNITDIICMTVNHPDFQGEIFFTSGVDSKLKAWKISGDTLEMLKALDSKNNAAVNSLITPGSEVVFAGCADGSIIAWNILQDQSDYMEPDGMHNVIKVLINGMELIVGRADKKIEIYDMANSSLNSASLTVRNNITNMVISNDALGCDVLLVAQDNGSIDMFNISKGSAKRFSYMMAYDNQPVHKIISYEGLFGIDKGIMTVSNDGCISIWQWKKPTHAGQSSRGGYRGRGGRGGRGDRGSRGGYRGRGNSGGGFQGGQGRGF